MIRKILSYIWIILQILTREFEIDVNLRFVKLINIIHEENTKKS